MSFSRRLILIGLTLPFLSACGEIREDLGFGRNVPDEFAVVDRAPLSMPPDYTLRPPRPGAARPQDVGSDHQASEVVLGSKGGKTQSAPSPAEQAILEASGGAKADPNIRETVDRESAQKVVADEHLVHELLNWNNDSKKAPTTTVDAAAEAERIKKAKENNESITAGATPVIEKEKTGWLGL